MALQKGGGAVSPPKIQDSTKNNKVELNSTSNQIEFTTNNVLKSVLDTNGNLLLGISSATTSGIELERSSASSDFGLVIKNTSNGDAKATFATAANQFSLGIDNSDDDKFKISSSLTDVGTSTLFTLDSSGNITLTGILDLGSNKVTTTYVPASNEDLTNKLYVDTVAAGQNELSEMTDVTITSLATGHVLYADSGTTWANAAPGATSGVQAHDDVLDDLSALVVVAADQLIYGTGAGTFGYSSLTSFSRNLLDDSTATDARATLELNAGQAGDIWVEKAGDTMTGLLTLSGDPTASLHAVTKQYADGIATGLDPKESVKAATTVNLSGYSPTGGTGGAGEFTNINTTAFDGYSTSVNDRVLVLNQTDAKQNGIYIITTVNATTGVMERAADQDGTPSNEVSAGNTTFVEQGSTYSGRTYSLAGDGEITLNTDDLVWNLISNATDWTWGSGLDNSGNIVSAVLEGTGISSTLGTLSFNGDAIGVDLGLTSTTAMPGDANITNINDVTLASLSGGNLFYYNGGGNDWRNAELLYWDSTNNWLGVGESTPTNRLHVTSATDDIVSVFESSDSLAGIELKDNAGSTQLTTTGDLFQVKPAAGSSVFQANTLIIDSLVAHGFADGTAASPSITLTNDTDTGMFSASGVNNLGFATAGLERGRITQDGNWGIGTNNVPFQLTLPGGSELGWSTDSPGIITARDSMVFNIDYDDNQTGREFSWRDGGSGLTGSVLMTLTDTGRLGIGITPSATLQVDTVAADSTSGLWVWDGAGSALKAYKASTNVFTVEVSSGNNLTLDNLGSVGIKQDSPTAALHIGDSATDTNSVVRIEASSLSTINFADAADINIGLIQYDHTSNFMQFNTNDTEAMRINSSGNVLFLSGSVSAPSLSFIGDTDTGIYRVAADHLGLAAGSTLIQSITTSGATIQSGSLRVPNGSASVPSLSFKDDTDCGLYIAGTNNIGMASGGTAIAEFNTSAVQFSPSNGVGIPDGSTTIAGLFFNADSDTGIYRLGANNLGILSAAQKIAEFNTSSIQFFSELGIPDGTATNPGLFFNADNDTGIFSGGANILSFSTNSTERLQIQSDGTLRLSSNQQIEWGGSEANGVLQAHGHMFFNIDSNNNQADRYFSWGKDREAFTGGSELMRLAETGTLTLSTYGAGTLSTNASGVVSASDARIKNVLNREVIGRDTVMALTPRWWDYNGVLGYEPGEPQLGFVAQEVAEVNHDFAPGDDSVPVEESRRNYHDRAILASLVKHNQELENDKEELQTKVSELEGTLSEILNRLNKLEDK